MYPRILVFLTSMILVVACAKGYGMILEKDDVQFLKVVPHADSEERVSIEVSGLAFHSALAVSGHREVRSGDTLTILVELVPAEKDMSGSFDFSVSVPQGVTVVRFGEKRAEIWHR